MELPTLPWIFRFWKFTLIKRYSSESVYSVLISASINISCHQQRIGYGYSEALEARSMA